MQSVFLLTFKPLTAYSHYTQILTHSTIKRPLQNKYILVKNTDGLTFIDYDTNEQAPIVPVKYDYRMINDSLSVSRDINGQAVISTNSSIMLSTRMSYELRPM